MPRTFVRQLLAVGAALAVLAWARAVHAGPPTRAASEAARVQAHLDGALARLRARDVSALTPAQRAARARAVERLQRYRDAGRFPHNHDFPGRRVPYFVDRHGTPCAMAYLIAASGRGDLVRRVAATRNNARVRELAGDAELVAWLEENGLTLEEAARVQPEYACGFATPCPEPEEENHDYEIATAASGVVNGAMIALNLPGSRGVGRGALAVATGLASVGLGMAGAHGDAGIPYVAFNFGIGSVAAALGLQTLTGRNGADTALRREIRLAPGRDLTLSATPLASTRGAGVNLNLRF
ncbi:MAG TPA: hypothetical protein VF746_23190 [Longimicrobium sp.]|jgi:hypothetical protein